MSDIANKLREARGLIERGWCQGAFARRADGSAVRPIAWDTLEPTYSAYCPRGAILAQLPWSLDPQFGELVELFERANRLEASTPDKSAVVAWNDAPGRTQADALAAFDRAIALAEQEAAQ